MYTRYWLEFEDPEIPGQRRLINCFGVTAIDINDALQIVKSKAFRNQALPTIVTQIENVDVRDLDQNHVIPNMLSPNSRGIWFPMGFSH